MSNAPVREKKKFAARLSYLIDVSLNIFSLIGQNKATPDLVSKSRNMWDKYAIADEKKKGIHGIVVSPQEKIKGLLR
jgi:hypothetical protein